MRYSIEPKYSEYVKAHRISSVAWKFRDKYD